MQSGVALRKDGKYQALVGRFEPNGAWLVLPQSFMNASGRAVQMLAGFFKIAPAEILVVHDELDFEPGTAKIKQGGGIAGHNGLKDISQRLGSHDYWRLRLGIGHPGDATRSSTTCCRSPRRRPCGYRRGDRPASILPLCLSGDMQGAMQKLHSVEKEKKARPVEKKAEPPKAAAKPATKPEPKPEPKVESKPEPEKKGLFGSLFGKKK